MVALSYPYGKKGGFIGVDSPGDTVREDSRTFHYSLDGLLAYLVVAIVLMLVSQYFIPLVFHILFWSGFAIILFILNKWLLQKVIVTQDSVELRHGALGLKQTVINVSRIVDISVEDLKVIKNTLKLTVTDRTSSEKKNYILDGVSNPSVIYNLIKRIRHNVADVSGEKQYVLENNLRLNTGKIEQRILKRKVDLSDGDDIVTLRPSTSMCFIEAAIVVPIFAMKFIGILMLAAESGVVACLISLVISYLLIFAFLKESHIISITNDSRLKIVHYGYAITLVDISSISNINYSKDNSRMFKRMSTIEIFLKEPEAKVFGDEVIRLTMFLVKDSDFNEFRKRVLGDKAAEIKATPDVC